jgi:hypothetical protein
MARICPWVMAFSTRASLTGNLLKPTLCLVHAWWFVSYQREKFSSHCVWSNSSVPYQNHCIRGARWSPLWRSIASRCISHFLDGLHKCCHRDDLRWWSVAILIYILDVKMIDRDSLNSSLYPEARWLPLTGWAMVDTEMHLRWMICKKLWDHLYVKMIGDNLRHDPATYSTSVKRCATEIYWDALWRVITDRLIMTMSNAWSDHVWARATPRVLYTPILFYWRWLIWLCLS